LLFRKKIALIKRHYKFVTIQILKLFFPIKCNFYFDTIFILLILLKLKPFVVTIILLQLAKDSYLVS